MHNKYKKVKDNHRGKLEGVVHQLPWFMNVVTGVLLGSLSRNSEAQGMYKSYMDPFGNDNLYSLGSNLRTINKEKSESISAAVSDFLTTESARSGINVQCAKDDILAFQLPPSPFDLSGAKEVAGNFFSGFKNVPAYSGMLFYASSVMVNFSLAEIKRNNEHADLVFYKNRSWNQVEKALGKKLANKYESDMQDLIGGTNIFSSLVKDFGYGLMDAGRTITGAPLYEKFKTYISQSKTSELISLGLVGTSASRARAKFRDLNDKDSLRMVLPAGVMDAINKTSKEIVGNIDPNNIDLFTDEHFKQITEVYGDNKKIVNDLMILMTPACIEELRSRGYSFNSIIEYYHTAVSEIAKDNNDSLTKYFGTQRITTLAVYEELGDIMSVHRHYDAMSHLATDTYKFIVSNLNKPNKNTKEANKLREKLEYFANFTSNVSNKSHYSKIEMVARALIEDLDSMTTQKYTKLTGRSTTAQLMHSKGNMKGFYNEMSRPELFFKKVFDPYLKHKNIDVSHNKTQWDYCSITFRNILEKQAQKSKEIYSYANDDQDDYKQYNFTDDKLSKDKEDNASQENIAIVSKMLLLLHSAIPVTALYLGLKPDSLATMKINLGSMTELITQTVIAPENTVKMATDFMQAASGDAKLFVMGALLVTASINILNGYLKVKHALDTRDGFMGDKVESWKIVGKYLSEQESKSYVDFSQVMGRQSVLTRFKNRTLKSKFNNEILSRMPAEAITTSAIVARILKDKDSEPAKEFIKILDFLDPSGGVKVFHEESADKLISMQAEMTANPKKIVNHIIDQINYVNAQVNLSRSEDNKLDIIGDKNLLFKDVMKKTEMNANLHTRVKSFCELYSQMFNSYEDMYSSSKELKDILDKEAQSGHAEPHEVNGHFYRKVELQSTFETSANKFATTIKELALFKNAKQVFSDHENEYDKLELIARRLSLITLGKAEDIPNNLQAAEKELGVPITIDIIKSPERLFDEVITPVLEKEGLHIKRELTQWDYFGKAVTSIIGDYATVSNEELNSTIDNKNARDRAFALEAEKYRARQQEIRDSIGVMGMM